ncbi:hypothetical protein [Streptomyces sp. NPDC059564]|uniref:hypothetical protein n=1 Tax=Streptomyces sp. NPDC059564 TaxID=3346865 RepID=UPI0036A2B41C
MKHPAARAVGTAFTGDGIRMTVRDFFTPAQLAEFVDRPYNYQRARWDEQALLDPERRLQMRRLPGEPGVGALCTWAPALRGFTYEVEAATGTRSGLAAWVDASDLIDQRLTPVRYGALRQAVDAEAAHERAYHRSPAPFRDPEMWLTHAYRLWAQTAAGLALRVSAAKEAILPTPHPQPALF